MRYWIASLILALAPVAAAAELPPLTWAPPAGYDEYEAFRVPASGGMVHLPSPEVHYRLVAPETITAPVTLRGGGNVVWIGGHIRIDRAAATSEKPSGTARRALVITDARDATAPREIHIEGLLIDGDDLAEGINTACPLAQVTIQNVRIELVRLRGCDDRDGTNGYGISHPDIIQTWGSHRGLRVDGLTGASNYQGIFLKEDRPDRNRMPAWLRRVNLRAVACPDEAMPEVLIPGHRMITLYPDLAGQLFLDSGTVWVRHHPDSGQLGQGRFYKTIYRDPETGALRLDPSPGTATLASALGHQPPQLFRDERGEYAQWRDDYTVSVNQKPAVRNFADTGPGRVYGGEPPEGDYVPAEAVGLSYQSPGYRRSE